MYGSHPNRLEPLLEETKKEDRCISLKYVCNVCTYKCNLL